MRHGRHQREAEVDPFYDMLFNMLIAFVFCFIVALLAMNPKALKAGDIPAKAEYIITISWPDLNPNDIDAWVENPAGETVWFRHREAALIESYHPLHLGWMLGDVWDDVDGGVAVSFELYEGFKHFHSLRTYLEIVGYQPEITDAEILAIRTKARATGPQGTLVDRLVEFMLSEHLASYFFRRVGEQVEDAVLSELLSFIAADEVRHAQAASDLLAARIACDPSLIPAVLDATLDFRHFGNQVVDDVPVAFPGDPLAIRSFAKRIERLCGVRIVDHIKKRL